MIFKLHILFCILPFTFYENMNMFSDIAFSLCKYSVISCRQLPLFCILCLSNFHFPIYSISRTIIPRIVSPPNKKQAKRFSFRLACYPLTYAPASQTLLQSLCDLVRAGSRLHSASDPFHAADRLFHFHPLQQGGNALQVAVTTAFRSDISDHSILHIDGKSSGTHSSGCILDRHVFSHLSPAY